MTRLARLYSGQEFVPREGDYFAGATTREVWKFDTVPVRIRIELDDGSYAVYQMNWLNTDFELIGAVFLPDKEEYEDEDED